MGTRERQWKAETIGRLVVLFTALIAAACVLTSEARAADPPGLGECTSATKVAVAGDGSTVFAGPVDCGNDYHGRFMVGRLTEGGALDESFGAGGVTMLPQGLGPVLSLQPLSGNRTLVARERALVMLDGRGDPSPDFGGDGIVTGVLGSATVSGISAATATATGDVYVVGNDWLAYPAGNPVTKIAKLTPRGTLDETFGDGGRRIVEAMVDGSPYSASMAGDVVAMGGRVVVSGVGWTGEASSAYAMAFLPDGELDPAFGDAGISTTDLDDAWIDATDLMLGGGSLRWFVSAGSSDLYSCPAYGKLIELDATGQQLSEVELQRCGDPRSVESLPDGRIAIADLWAPRLTPIGFRARVLDADGRPDGSFGLSNGFAIFDVGAGGGGAWAVAAGPGNRLTVAGSAGSDPCSVSWSDLDEAYAYGPCRGVAVIARLDPNGVPDASFGHGGFVTLPELRCDRGGRTEGSSYRACAEIVPRQHAKVTFRRAASGKPRLGIVFDVDPMPSLLRLRMPKALRLKPNAVKRTSGWVGGSRLPNGFLTRTGRDFYFAVGDGRGYAPVRILFRRGSLKPLAQGDLRRRLRFRVTAEPDAPDEKAFAFRKRPLPGKKNGSPSR